MLDQCYPEAGSIRFHTCSAYQDTQDAKVCDSSGPDVCGAGNFDDGTCVVIFERCSVGCETTADCPEGTTCEDIVVESFCL
jgi:hypothetical protein